MKNRIARIILAFLAAFGLAAPVVVATASSAQAVLNYSYFYNGDGYNTGWSIGINNECRDLPPYYSYLLGRGQRTSNLACGIFIGSGACVLITRWIGWNQPWDNRCGPIIYNPGGNNGDTFTLSSYPKP